MKPSNTEIVSALKSLCEFFDAPLPEPQRISMYCAELAKFDMDTLRIAFTTLKEGRIFGQKVDRLPSVGDFVRACVNADVEIKRRIEQKVYFLAHAKSSAEVLEKFPTINIEHIKRIKKAQKGRRGGLEGQKADFRAYLLDPSKIDEIAPFLLECGKDEKPVNEDPEELERIKKLFLSKEEPKQPTQGA